jgi:hypothetical protein
VHALFERRRRRRTAVNRGLDASIGSRATYGLGRMLHRGNVK